MYFNVFLHLPLSFFIVCHYVCCFLTASFNLLILLLESCGYVFLEVFCDHDLVEVKGLRSFQERTETWTRTHLKNVLHSVVISNYNYYIRNVEVLKSYAFSLQWPYVFLVARTDIICTMFCSYLIIVYVMTETHCFLKEMPFGLIINLL